MYTVEVADERPVKRRRLSRSELPAAIVTGEQHLDHGKGRSNRIPSPTSSDPDLQKETRAGITAFVSPYLPGFSGILKQRYTDFLVNEIQEDGQVLHLRNLKPPRPARNFDIGSELEEATSSMTPGATPTGSAIALKHDLDSVPAESSASVSNFDKVSTPRPLNSHQLDEDDEKTLIDLLGTKVCSLVVLLYHEVAHNTSKKSKVSRSIRSEKIDDRAIRTKVHQEIRRIFKSKLETTTSDDDTINISPAVPVGKGRSGGSHLIASEFKGKLGWEELGGEYVHFTLYKENKDTMEALQYLSFCLKTQPKTFGFGGTKDRRAVTVQRCSAYRIRAEQLSALNPKMMRSRVGDFKYSPACLELGDLNGNEFVITLRDCHFPGEDGLDHNAKLALARDILTKSVKSFRSIGFINYFGLQRFGTFAVSNDLVGIKLLKGDLGAAVSDILAFSPVALAAAQHSDATSKISQDDKDRAEGIHIWLTTQDCVKALERLPRKFHAESSIIRHLGKRERNTGRLTQINDHQGALNAVTRNLRLMYVHAYQSMVWNNVAGKRWEKFGDLVVEGDLVLVKEHENKDPASRSTAMVDEQGEPIFHAAPNDRATRAEEDFERARPLSAGEATGGNYTIYDLVLPLPGYDVVYPPNDIGEEYKTFMSSEQGGGIDPYDMRRAWRDVSLSGGYRKILARPGAGMDFDVRTYVRAEEQLVQTDLDSLNGMHKVEESSTIEDEVVDPKIAVILEMKLGSSQYATMALRELMKGVKNYKPDFGLGR